MAHSALRAQRILNRITAKHGKDWPLNVLVAARGYATDFIEDPDTPVPDLLDDEKVATIRQIVRSAR